MKTKAVHLASILLLGISLMALTPLQQSTQAQQVDPLPIPRLTLNSVQDSRNLGTQFTYTFSVTNWPEFQRQVNQRYDAFDPATMQLPPSPCKIEGDARFPARMAAMIYSSEGKPLSCYPLFTPKGQLAEIKLTIPKANAATSFYLVIRDLRTTERVKSNTVDTGSHNKAVPITNVSDDVQLQRAPEATPRGSKSGGPQPPPTSDLPKVLVAEGRGVSRATSKRMALPPYRTQVLTKAQMQSVLRSAQASMPNKPTLLHPDASFNDFVTLTPQQPYVEGRGRLDFQAAASIETGSSQDDPGSAHFDLNNYDGGVEIHLKPEKIGESFIVSISIIQPFGHSPFTVDLTDGRQEQYLMPPPQKGATSLPPMLLLFTANNTGWQHIRITNVGAGGLAGWAFFKCEVKSIQPN